MLAKQQYMYAALVGFGSLAQAAVQFPTCITSCVRQNGCAPTNTDCMCEKASGNFLSDVVICMNQWCSSDTKFSDLIGPIQSNCKVSQDAIDAAVSKAGFDTSGSSSGSDSDSSSAGSSSKASSTAQVVSATMGVGAPNKIDGSTSVPEATAPPPRAQARCRASCSQTRPPSSPRRQLLPGLSSSPPPLAPSPAPLAPQALPLLPTRAPATSPADLPTEARPAAPPEEKTPPRPARRRSLLP
ncbi:hypothetical protein K449DRAFT_227172 [Hypoxylon sp. EC38]|nr:hypothetical protein K449DRAFT_227172 [Hypoxylon sp. EC38]